MKKYLGRKMFILGVCLICLVAFGEAVAAEEETQETETEQIARALPEDGVLYYDVENEDKGAIRLVEENGTISIQYDGKQRDEAETGSEEKEETELSVFETPETFYATTALYMRAMPETEAEIVQVLKIGQQITIYAETGEKWFLAETEKGYGFVAKKYLTDDEEAAEQAVATEEAVRQAAAEEAARQAAAAEEAARQAAAASQSASNSNKVHEVSRENVPNCDDGSHGTTYITYSDGSVKTVNY